MASAQPTSQELLRLERAQERETLARMEALLLVNNARDATSVGMESGLADEVPKILHRLWDSDRITDGLLHDLLSDVWSHNTEPLACLGRRAWVSMFTATGYFCRTQTTEGASQPFPPHWRQEQPTEAITVWRGAHSDSGGRGMSWSSYRECALAFAHVRADRWGEGVLYQATVPGRAVLAQFVGLDEQEVVINPDFLRGRIEVDTEVTASREATQSRQGLRDLLGL